MTQPTHLRAEYFGLELPIGAKDIHSEVSMTGTPYIAYKFRDDELVNEYEDIVLPPGSWQIVCISKECSEEIAKQMVDSSEWHFPVKHTRYVDYAFPFDRENKQRWSEGYGTAKESLASLLKSKNLNPDNTLILKKL